MTQLSRAALKEFFKAGSKAVNRQYEDLIDSIYGIGDDISPILPTKFGKLLLVDPSALPGEGERGNINQPYPNPNDARLDALDGDVVLIFPGSYTCTNIFKAGVTYYAFPGTTILTSGAGVMGPPALFEDYSSPAGVCKFLGKAKLVTQNNSFLINLNTSITTEVIIECEEIETNTVGFAPAIVGGPAKMISVTADTIKYNDTNLFISTNPSKNFTINLKSREVNFQGEVPFIHVLDGRVNVDINILRANGYVIDNPVFDIANAGDHRICIRSIETNTTKLVHPTFNKAKVYLENIRYVTSTDFVTTDGVISGFPSSDPVVIPAESIPSYMDQSPNGMMYVPSRGSNIVTVIDTTDDSVADSIDVGMPTNKAIYVPSNGYIYIGGISGSASVVVIDPDTNTVVTTISVGSSNFFLNFCPLNNNVYVVDADFSIVYAVDTTSNTVVATIPTGGADPFPILFVPDTNLLYVIDSSAGLLSVIDPLTNTLVTNVFVQFDIRRFVYVPDNGNLYITSGVFGSLYAVSTLTNTVVLNSSVGVSPSELCYCPTNGHVYIPCLGSGFVRVLNPLTNIYVATIHTGFANSCIFNSNDGYIYVANLNSGTVSVIDPATNQIIKTYHAVPDPWMPVVSDVSKKIYVPNRNSSSVTALVSPADMGEIVVKNCEFLETGEASGALSVKGEGSVKILGTLNTNMPKDPVTVVQVGELNYDTNLTA